MCVGAFENGVETLQNLTYIIIYVQFICFAAKQRFIVFVYQDYDFASCLLMGAINKIYETN